MQLPSNSFNPSIQPDAVSITDGNLEKSKDNEFLRQSAIFGERGSNSVGLNSKSFTNITS